MQEALSDETESVTLPEKSRRWESAKQPVVRRYSYRVIATVDVAGTSPPYTFRDAFMVVVLAISAIFKELIAVLLAVNVIDLTGSCHRDIPMVKQVFALTNLRASGSEGA